MDWFNVLDRIQAGEDEYTELGRYRSFSEKDWQKTACAFPNHKRRESVLAGGTPRSRNESIAHVLFDLGLMEQRGSGFPRIRRAMRDFNETEPLLEDDPDERWVRVTLWRD